MNQTSIGATQTQNQVQTSQETLPGFLPTIQKIDLIKKNEPNHLANIVEDYLHQNDWMVKENANQGFSLQGLNNFLSSKIITRYWLDMIYPSHIKQAHDSGDIHIHDLNTLGPYCVGWDLSELLSTGFGGVRGKVESGPPKHLRTALHQMVNFLYTMQGEAAGAQAFSNVDTLLAPYIARDKLTFEQVKQCVQEFVFNLAVPTRVGFQTPFTNITLDLTCPKHMANEYVKIGGNITTDTYAQFQKEMDMFNQAFAQVMLAGDSKGKIFTFPIPTYNITKDFDFGNPAYEIIWEMTAKYGIPYFSNFVNSDMSPEDARSMCCRLRLNNAELRKRGGGLFASTPLTGSIGVVTINLPRIGYTSATKHDFFEKLDKLLDYSYESLELKRRIVEQYTSAGLYPYSKHYLATVYSRHAKYWMNHFSTIGILGMNEALVNMYGCTIAQEQGQQFAIEILEHIKQKLAVFQSQSGVLYNLEATPGESTSHRFARLDKKLYPHIKVANESQYQSYISHKASAHEKGIECAMQPIAPYYTNSTHLPVNYTDDLFEALTLQDPLQVQYTGGTVHHIFVGEKLTTSAVKKLVQTVSANFHLPYFTLTPTFSVCPIHGYLSGDHEYCPICDQQAE
jgi:ribonucleoside-triphosphate reductase (formate)